MLNQPSIYVDFYSRYISNGVSVARMGGGELCDVLRYICRPGISVVSSLRSPPGCPTITMGRALVDPERGLAPLELPPLDANGGPFWLFWEGNDLTAKAAAFIQNHHDLSIGQSVLWLRIEGRIAINLLSAEDVVASLESSWTDAWPSGSVFVRFEGDTELLARWIRTQVDDVH